MERLPAAAGGQERGDGGRGRRFENFGGNGPGLGFLKGTAHQI